MIHKWLNIIFLVVVILLGISFFQKGKLPGVDRVHPDLHQDPIQKETGRAPFTVEYKGTTYSIKPVADYELWGLVVSHNKTSFMFDIYHDKTSFDTKDIAVIWGDNLRSSDFRKVKYWNGPWTGRARWDRGVTFIRNNYSNNHLITSETYMRDEIAGINIGDQVHLKGMLVNYAHPGWEKYERKSSLVREDKGRGACEVFFVEQVEILRNGTPGWYLTYSFAIVFLVAVPIIKLLLILLP